MKNFLLPLLIICLSVLTAFGQNTFHKVYRFPDPNNQNNLNNFHLADLQPTSDGGYILYGTSLEDEYGSEKPIVLIKTDALGDTIWTRQIGDPGQVLGFHYLHMTMGKIRQTATGGYLATLNIFYEEPAAKGSDASYLLELSATGQLINTHIIDEALSLEHTGDGNFARAGVAVDYNSFPYSFTTRIHKLTPDASSIWLKQYTTPYPHGIALADRTNDDGFLLVGYSSLNFQSAAKPYVIRTNAAGDTLWTKKYTFLSNYRFSSGMQTADNGYIFAGSSLLSGWPITHQSLVVRTNTAGDTLWTRSLPWIGHDIPKVIENINGNILLLANKLVSGQGTGTTTQATLVCFSPAGQLLWTKLYGGSNNEQTTLLLPLADGSLVFGGSTNSYFNNTYQIFLTKADSTGELSITCSTPVINPLPDTVACAGQYNYMTDVLPSVPVTTDEYVTWYLLPATGNPVMVGAYQNWPNVNTATPFKFMAKVSTVIGSCQASDTITVTVYPVPEKPAITGNAQCASAPASFTLTALNPVGTVEWFSGGYSLEHTGPVYVTPPSTTGSRYVRQVVDGCASPMKHFQLSFSASNPNIQIAGDACQGNTLMLYTSGNYDSYSWTGPNGFNSTQAQAILPTVSAANNGNYTLLATSSNCTVSPVHYSLSVNQVSTPTILGTTQLCTGSALNLSATGSGAFSYNYSWVAPNQLVSINNNYSVPAVTSADAGVYSVFGVSQIGSSQGCISTPATVTVSVQSADATFSYPSATACLNAGTMAPAVSQPGAGTFSSNNSGLVFISISTGEINLQTSMPGSYTVTHAITGNCPASSTFQLQVAAPPAVSISASALTAGPGQAIQLQVQPGTGPYTYLWSPAAGLTNATLANPVAVLQQSTTYWLTVTDTVSGCASTDSISLILNGISAQAFPGNMQVFPNPFTNLITIQIPGNETGRLHIQLIDQLGRIVASEERQLATAANAIEFAIPASLASGLYHLSVQLNGQSGFWKLQKE